MQLKTILFSETAKTDSLIPFSKKLIPFKYASELHGATFFIKGVLCIHISLFLFSSFPVAFLTVHNASLQLHLRYQVEDLPSRSVGCNIQVLSGIAWLKFTRQQKKITKNIMSNLQDRLKVMFSVLEKEYVSGA